MSTADETEDGIELPETHDEVEQLQDAENAWKLLEAGALSTEFLGSLHTEFSRYEELLDSVVTEERYEALRDAIEQDTGRTPSPSYDQLTPLHKGILAVDIINGAVETDDAFRRDGAKHYDPLSLLTHLSEIAGEPHAGERPYEEKEDEIGGLEYGITEDGLGREEIEEIVSEVDIQEDEMHVQEDISLANVDDTELLDAYRIAAHLIMSGGDGYGGTGYMPLYGHTSTDEDGEWTEKEWLENGEPAHEDW
ncbi:MAG: hypothetical protein ABEI58_00290 [Candidatus Nanohaloarchaea archaeon]